MSDQPEDVPREIPHGRLPDQQRVRPAIDLPDLQGEFTDENSSPPQSKFELPELKRPPAFGVYLWWPQPGRDWIHPDERRLRLVERSRLM